MTLPTENFDTDGDDLRAAVAHLHRRIDAWHAAVVGVSAEAGDDSDDALADPRLEDAQDRFYEALSTFEDASLPVLGLVPVEPEDDGSPGGNVLADDFFLHFVVGIPGDQDAARLDQVLQIVDESGFAVMERLEAAGFHVPQFGSSRGGFAEIDDEDDIR